MNALKEYWYKLPARDQRVLGIGILVVLSILLYSLLWVPMQDQLKRQRLQLVKYSEDLAWMQEQADMIRQLEQNKTGSGNSTDVPLLTIIDQTAKKLKLRDQIKQIQPGKESGTAKIWFDKVVFEDWLQWLDQISARGIEVTRVSITKSAQFPMVNIRLEVSL
ncbi:type II secretion system protein M [bacterium BMS3Bbin11]|nr:type II secretion system protein M [bacterium BMS3Abin11]GBE46162.1 type II secretion system protein M [bacterium BMS3Bbin11]HDH15483.1 type II secretion system protein M [Gammaproteobacteria bacterium]